MSSDSSSVTLGIALLENKQRPLERRALPMQVSQKTRRGRAALRTAWLP